MDQPLVPPSSRQRVVENVYSHPRFRADAAAVVLHLVSVASIMGTHPDFASTTQGTILCVMEAITIVAHLVYLARLAYFKETFTQWQTLKWLEYSISATLGIFAVAYVAGGEVDTNTILLLVAAGLAQQSQGYQLEDFMKTSTFQWTDANIVISFLLASVLQGFEFIVVHRIINDSPGKGGTEELVFWSYVLGYGFFGQSHSARAPASSSHAYRLYHGRRHLLQNPGRTRRSCIQHRKRL